MLAIVIIAIIYLLLLTMIVAYLAFLWECWQNKAPGRIIYHGSNLKEQGKALELIIKKYIPNTGNYTMVEPGAGLGKVAEYLADKFSWRQVIAIELGPVVYLLGKMRMAWKRKKMAFLCEDIFKYNFPTPSLIYCYISEEMITRLYQEKRLDKSLVISLTFPIKGLTPTEEISLSGWQKRLLVYDLR